MGMSNRRSRRWVVNPQSFGVRVFAVLVLAFLLGCSAAWGQNTGSMQGQITDPTSDATAQAKVEITETASGVTRTTTTDAAGPYRDRKDAVQARRVETSLRLTVL